MQYGFAIDQRTCIGCHACTVACKTEHDIPLGQFRTWVKYVDSGEYPSTTRDFGVMRCNHCSDAPCVAICPTGALFKRDDGIVDFDRDRCIGCKACMQACPYDAIYLDEETHTAAKCNFCAHRVDQGLEPACSVVCPTQSIWVGDLDDPNSGISTFLQQNDDVAVRSPEQNTRPNVVYLGAAPQVLDPLAAPVEGTYLWAQPDEQRLATAEDLAGTAQAHAVTTLNTAHPRPWGWRVATYLWTKSVAAGALLIAAFLGLEAGWITTILAPAVALGMTAVTGALLVADLKRPERFLYLFLKGNPRSWLVLGGYALAVFGLISAAWLIAGIAGADAVVEFLRWPAIPAAVLAAGYTAFLFAQAEGRDLWQSPVLFWHLIAQAILAGAGALGIVTVFGVTERTMSFLAGAFVVGVVGHLVALAAEYSRKHPTRNAAVAARVVVRGRYARVFWVSTAIVAVTGIAATLAGVWELGWLMALAGIAVQACLLAYETVYLRAAQDVPLS